MQPEYRFPDMATARLTGEALAYLHKVTPHAPLIGRVAAAVVTARPDVHPVAAMARLTAAMVQAAGEVDGFRPSQWHRLTMAGLALVATDAPPPPPPERRTSAA